MHSSSLSFSLAQASGPSPDPWLAYLPTQEQILIIVALVSIVLAALSVIRDFLGWTLGTWLKDQRLKTAFGATLYDRQEIKNWARHYVRPDVTSLDPALEMEERNANYIAREDLFKVVEHFLNGKSGHRHMLLLADSGMGKSSFVANFYLYNQRKWGKRHRLAVVPLTHPKAMETIDGIPDKGETILFLDAFDEDPSARPKYWKRLNQLMAACSEFSHVLITCRTQFFPKDDEIPVDTGLVRIGPTSGNAQHTFRRFYLAPLSDQQVDRYLRKLFPFWSPKRKRARNIVKQVPVLSIRPMLLCCLPDIIHTNEEVKSRWQLYELMTRRWYEREIKTWKSIEAIEAFSQELAVTFYRRFLKDGRDRVSPRELREIFTTLPKPVNDSLALSRSLLHRDAQGNVKFAHWSIMEFLFIKRFFDRDHRCGDLRWTTQMKEFVVEIYRSFDLHDHPIKKKPLTGSDLSGVDLSGADLSAATLRNVDLSGANLGNTNLTGANLNQAKLTGSDLSGASLSGAYCIKANLIDADLRDANLDGTYLREANFAQANLTGASLKGATLVGANFSSAILKNTDLTDATLCGGYFIDANFESANLTGTDLSRAYLMRADFRNATLDGANFEAARISSNDHKVVTN